MKDLHVFIILDLFHNSKIQSLSESLNGRVYRNKHKQKVKPTRSMMPINTPRGVDIKDCISLYPTLFYKK